MKSNKRYYLAGAIGVVILVAVALVFGSGQLMQGYIRLSPLSAVNPAVKNATKIKLSVPIPSIPAPAAASVPNPVLKYNKFESGDVWLMVDNYQSYPPEMFSPKADPQQSGLGLTRTAVYIFDADTKKSLMSFGGLQSPSDLNTIYFYLANKVSNVFISMYDSQTGITYTSNTVQVPASLTSSLFPQSKYFLGSESYYNAGNIDLNNELLFDGYYIKTQGFAYKMLIALDMLGYSYSGGEWGKETVKLSMLNKFQSKNNFPVSSTLTKEEFTLLDKQLAERETKFAGSSNKFSPLFTKIYTTFTGGNYSLDYIAWVFTAPIEALPLNLQVKNFSQYSDCISGQCIGQMVDQNGKPYLAHTVLTPNKTFFFSPGFFRTPVQVSQLDYSVSQIIFSILHEYGHFLDSTNSAAGSPTVDFPQRGSINTVSFYDISWNSGPNAYVPPLNGLGMCTTQKSGQSIKDFISYYAYSYGGGCPAGSGGPLEEFAESFAAYVAQGRSFRAAALKSPILLQKYNWLKNNVFGNVEYDTDMIVQNEVFAGCSDGDSKSNSPGYLSCDYGKVWDGEFRKL